MLARQNLYFAPNVGFNEALKPRASCGKAAKRILVFDMVDDVEEELIDKAQESTLGWFKHSDSGFLTSFRKGVTRMTRLAFFGSCERYTWHSKDYGLVEAG
jgi:hypothetical protein